MSVRVSPTEFLWREWRLGEGRFKGKGPKSSPRPKELYSRPTAKERPFWFARLAAYLARRKPVPLESARPLGAFGKPTALYRNPRGGVEDVAAAVAGGLRTALLSLDHTPSEWAELGRRFDAANVTWGYWFHCRTEQHVKDLLQTSKARYRPIVGINVEAELAGALNPAKIKTLVLDSGYAGEVATVLYGWVQNGVDCRPIGDWPALLEIMPQDDKNLWHPRVKVHHCLEHAQIQGIKLPIPMYGAYPMRPEQRDRIAEIHENPPETLQAQPYWYDMTLLHALYTVDDTGENWAAWGWT